MFGWETREERPGRASNLFFGNLVGRAFYDSDSQRRTQSVFDTRSITDIYDEICDVYAKYPQPWVIGYSGGKDSTTVLQLIWKALERLPPEERQKPVYVIASDTKVETPVIVDFIDTTLRLVNERAAETGTIPKHPSLARFALLGHS